MTKAAQIRKGDIVSIPIVLTGTVTNVTPLRAGARHVTVNTREHGTVSLVVPESHNITINQITVEENT